MTTDLAPEEGVLHLWVDVRASDDDALDAQQRVDGFWVELSHAGGLSQAEEPALDKPVRLIWEHLIVHDVQHLIDQLDHLRWERHNLFVQRWVKFINMLALNIEIYCLILFQSI